MSDIEELQEEWRKNMKLKREYEEEKERREKKSRNHGKGGISSVYGSHSMVAELCF